MRKKHLITPIPQDAPPRDEGWLDLDRVASVEVTSEEKDYNIESALASGGTHGWRVASPGTQTIRLLFDQPQRLRRISLVFEESETERTQEFVLRWSPDGGHSFREIVRQQWNFSPPNTIREVEEYRVKISDVTVLDWSSFLTSVEERLAPRSRVCACLDSRRSTNLLTLEEANHRR